MEHLAKTEVQLAVLRGKLQVSGSLLEGRSAMQRGVGDPELLGEVDGHGASAGRRVAKFRFHRLAMRFHTKKSSLH